MSEKTLGLDDLDPTDHVIDIIEYILVFWFSKVMMGHPSFIPIQAT
jgi:hypothetical protein